MIGGVGGDAIEQTQLINENLPLDPQPQVPLGSPAIDPARKISESPYFQTVAKTTAEITSSSISLHLSNVSGRGAHTPPHASTTRLDYSSDRDFRIPSDELDEGFLAELEDLEQRAYTRSQVEPVARLSHSFVLCLDSEHPQQRPRLLIFPTDFIDYLQLGSSNR